MRHFAATVTVSARDRGDALKTVATIERRFANVEAAAPFVTVGPLTEIGEAEAGRPAEIDTRCRGWVARKNERCRKPRVEGSDYCVAHDPDLAEARAAHLSKVRPKR